MSELPFRLRRAVPADAATLAEFAQRSFVETFGSANRPEDMAAYLPTAYGEARQRAEIVHPKWTTILAEAAPSTLIGFVQLREGAAGAAVQGRDPIEIQRFYVDSAFHGRGLAKTLMAAAENAAREAGWATLWLGVWEKNARAIAFYEKCGFRHVGEHPFLLGSDLQTDWVMEREL